MGFFALLLLGLIAGAVAKLLVPGRDPGGIITTMAIGVVGALLGGFVGGALFGTNPVDEFFDLSTWLTAIVGAVALLLVFRTVSGSRT